MNFAPGRGRRLAPARAYADVNVPKMAVPIATATAALPRRVITETSTYLVAITVAITSGASD